MKCYILSFFFFAFANIGTLLAQSGEKEAMRKYDILPAISYSPETALTLGVIGYRYLQLGDPITTTRSFINFLAIYTTNQQFISESRWDIFLKGNSYRFKGLVGYSQFPDRNYGLGNDANALVSEFEIDNGRISDRDDINYLRYSVDRFIINPLFLKRMAKQLYIGLSLDVENLYNYDVLPDSTSVAADAEGISVLENNITGLRSGVGLNVQWDARDNLLNPRSGYYIDISNTYYGGFLGSDYNYSNLRIDARKYYNFTKNHTLAFRVNTYWTFADRGDTPIRGLSRIGGNDLSRGYFRGTFQDRHLVSWQSEYRLPFWKDGVDAPLHKFWKRLGMVMFASGAQVYGDEDFSLDQFNYAVGTGLRVLFNPETRLNIRIDYALGLTPNANGPDGLQSGIYFFLSEAF